MDGRDTCCKLGRAIDRYDLAGLDEELPARWRGDGYEQTSLRSLADRVNEAILDAALAEAEVDRIDDDATHLYQRLTDDSTSRGTRTQLRNQLETEGVDLDTVESSFVSHQTVHSHLTDCLDVSHRDDDRTPAERRRDERQRIRSLQSRTEAVTTDALDRLDRRDDVDLAEFEIMVDVSVLCRECGRQTELARLVDEGGCQCQSGNDE